jgi:hypothetical protein
MTSEQFSEWVPIANAALGGGERFADVLSANARVFCEDWSASAFELGECVYRLVSEGRVPQWPNELTNAIHKELAEVRQRTRAMQATTADAGEVCSLCGGVGLVIVPHSYCVWRGAVVPYYNPKKKERRRAIYSVAVICDSTGKCEAGSKVDQSERVRCQDPVEEKKRPRMRTYRDWAEPLGGDNIDGIGLWRGYERRRAEDARRLHPRTEGENQLFDRLLSNIKAIETTE